MNLCCAHGNLSVIYMVLSQPPILGSKDFGTDFKRGELIKNQIIGGLEILRKRAQISWLKEFNFSLFLNIFEYFKNEN